MLMYDSVSSLFEVSLQENAGVLLRTCNISLLHSMKLPLVSVQVMHSSIGQLFSELMG